MPRINQSSSDDETNAVIMSPGTFVSYTRTVGGAFVAGDPEIGNPLSYYGGPS